MSILWSENFQIFKFTIFNLKIVRILNLKIVRIVNLKIFNIESVFRIFELSFKFEFSWKFG